MKVFRSSSDPEIVSMLQAGAIGALRTDTLYGIVAKADDESAVARVYAVKHRDQTKSPIILISSERQLYDEIPLEAQTFVHAHWPGPVSIILPSHNAPKWIRRTNESVAYRIPNLSWLQKLIENTGPLIAPSANPEGSPPAKSIAELDAYFGNKLDFAIDGGEVKEQLPSQLFRVANDGMVERLR